MGNLKRSNDLLKSAKWARGYYCGSAGHVSQEQVKRYIQEQMGKDVFEYEYPALEIEEKRCKCYGSYYLNFKEVENGKNKKTSD